MTDNLDEERKKEQCRIFIEKLAHSKHLVFTSRGNTAIDLAMNTAKSLGFTKLLIPRDGSWLHYPIVGKKKGFEINYINTIDGTIDPEEISSKADDKTVILFHSHAGYFQKIDVKRIYEISRDKNAFVIIDCSGALGLGYLDEEYFALHSVDYCDILVSSMRKNKPVEADGGFVATNSERIWGMIDTADCSLDYGFILERLNHLEDRMRFLTGLTKRHSLELREKGFKVLNDYFSLVIITAFDDLKTKENIINYCEMNNLEYEICPREIRVLRDAISIEIKRLKEEFEDAGKKSEF